MPFRGLAAFPITPADPEGRVDLDALGRLLERLLAAGVDSIGLLGSTGSYPYLSRAERRRAVAAAVEAVAGQIPLLVGIGALRTDETIALARDAEAAGAAAGLLAAVSYTPLLPEEVARHVEAVTSACGLPICLYDNPGTTHFSFDDALVARLARLPGVVAVKKPAPPADRVGAALAALRAAVPEGFAIGYSVDAHAAEALIAGGDAWYAVAGGLFPEPCLAIVRAAARGDAEEARRLDARLKPLWALFASHTSLRTVYAAATHLGLCRAAPPLPIQPLGRAARDEVAATLDALGLR